MYTALCTQIGYTTFINKIKIVEVFILANQVLYKLELGPILQSHGMLFKAEWSMCDAGGPKDIVHIMKKVAIGIEEKLGQDVVLEGEKGTPRPCVDVEAIWKGMTVCKRRVSFQERRRNHRFG